MCTIPPPPPPPNEPEILLNSMPQLLQTPNELNENFPEDICQWAIEYPELREACIKNNICLHDPPYQFSYKHFPSIKQIGPTCGLVALCMMLNGTKSPDEILNIAKSDRYTNNGEMFSCKSMLELAQKVVRLTELSGVNVSLRADGLCNDALIEKLLGGSVLLVPYDADFNHYPSLKLGHKAHWALVCGVLVLKDTEASYISEPGNVFVLCKHGKSLHLAAWKLEDLDSSNRNLVEFFAPKRVEELIYILPDGGIGGENGLKDQFVVVDGL